MRVLVVDDNRAVRQMVAAMLRESGYEVHVAEDGLAGWELTVRHGGKFDLVVTDIRMPRMDGNELIERVRAQYPGIKTLCMSAHADAKPPNFDYFIAKPFTFRAICDLVHDVLGAHSPAHDSA